MAAFHDEVTPEPRQDRDGWLRRVAQHGFAGLPGRPVSSATSWPPMGACVIRWEVRVDEVLGVHAVAGHHHLHVLAVQLE